MSLHEDGDDALRPTNKAWKCPNCGVELYTVDVIQAHKERCPQQIKMSKKFDTGDPELTVEQAEPFVNRLIEVGGAKCSACGDRLDGQPIKARSHSGGWTVKGLSEKQWLYIICPRCKCQNALWKLGVPRE